MGERRGHAIPGCKSERRLKTRQEKGKANASWHITELPLVSQDILGGYCVTWEWGPNGTTAPRICWLCPPSPLCGPVSVPPLLQALPCEPLRQPLGQPEHPGVEEDGGFPGLWHPWHAGGLPKPPGELEAAHGVRRWDSRGCGHGFTAIRTEWVIARPIATGKLGRKLRPVGGASQAWVQGGRVPNTLLGRCKGLWLQPGSVNYTNLENHHLLELVSNGKCYKRSCRTSVGHRLSDLSKWKAAGDFLHIKRKTNNQKTSSGRGGTCPSSPTKESRIFFVLKAMWVFFFSVKEIMPLGIVCIVLE